MLGFFSWHKLPVELLPALTGEQLYVNFHRPGTAPEVIERQILLPLQLSVRKLPGVVETFGHIDSTSGKLSIKFEPGSNHRVRELELQRIAAELSRTQPEGTAITVSSQDLSALSRFAMSIQVLAERDSNALRDLIEQQVQARISAIPGVSRVFITGGASQEVSIKLDMKRSADFGITPDQVAVALRSSIGGLQYLGNTQSLGQQFSVVLDTTVSDLDTLGAIPIMPDSNVLLRHIANIELSNEPQESVYRVNGKTSVGILIFQDEGANLVELGLLLKRKIDALKLEYNPYEIDFIIGFDASETVANLLERLQTLALSGFVIALLILYLFLRQIRAVAVVAIAVPVSLLAAGAMLFLFGYSLNVITLFGLTIGIGLLVDNSIVVYEAVQRCLERGADPDTAAQEGIRRTMRAIVTASATNAIVFLPLIFLIEEAMLRQLIVIIAAAILLPMVASLLVAAMLVPLLAQRLAAPAAVAHLKLKSEQRLLNQGMPEPNLPKELFSATLKIFLRRPSAWLTTLFVFIFVTLVIALPWVWVRSVSQPPAEASQVTMEVEFDGGGSLEAAGLIFQHFEQLAMPLDGVKRVETSYSEDQGSITVHLNKAKNNANNADATRVRKIINNAIASMSNVQLRSLNSNGITGGTELFEGESSFVAVSGPDMSQLQILAEKIQERLEAMQEVGSALVNTKLGGEELRINVNQDSLMRYQLNPEEVLSIIRSSGREGERLQTGYSVNNGQEIPIILRHQLSSMLKTSKLIENYRITTQHGSLRLKELISAEQGLPPPVIAHHNGRRELSVSYQLNENAPTAGKERVALENLIEERIRNIYRPDGYTIETRGATAAPDKFKNIFIPVILLLFAVLAIAFESVTMPLLILVAVPLTIIGAIWGLLLAGLGADMMAGVGVIVLLGLAVNPAILLVDRMQQKLNKGHCSAGAAAITAVRERVRPVLMTACTTLGGLWPMAIVTGQEMEIWPPFATVVMGGIATATLLTLLVIPVGFVMLSKIDKIFGKLGSWILILWFGLTFVTIGLLVIFEQLLQFQWQFISSCLVGGFFLWGLLKIAQYRENKTVAKVVARESSFANTSIETRYLSKVYNQLDPISKAWHRYKTFQLNSAQPNAQAAKQNVFTFLILMCATLYLATHLQGVFWQVGFSYVCGIFLSFFLIEAQRSVGLIKVGFWDLNDQQRLKFSQLVNYSMPWFVLFTLFVNNWLLPTMSANTVVLQPAALCLLAILTLLIQLGRNTALLIIQGKREPKLESGKLQWLHNSWRRFCLNFLGFDLKQPELQALSSISFKADNGMIGILGPNGAGKTTFLRLLASVLEPTSGSLRYADVDKRKMGDRVSELIGYLPQEFGLYDHFTAREYLNYFALLYRVGDKFERKQRVEELLKEVGLEKRQHEKISAFSGGMRQRIAVARTLLRLPSIIIVDEPTVGLDPRERIRFRNLLAKLAQKRLVLFSTHVVEDVEVSCQRVIVLRNGKLAYDGIPQDLADKARGKTWLLKVPESKVFEVESSYKVVTQINEGGGIVSMRVLSNDVPKFNAKQEIPTLEDGYLQLFNGES